MVHLDLEQYSEPALRVTRELADTGSQLDAIASEARIDLIVAGAYGHTRWSEWILGGVTRHLLQHSATCAFLMH
jgi:nucleotide-binding universal stress UspA family protein